MFDRVPLVIKIKAGVRRATAVVLGYVEDWPLQPNADIETEGRF